MKLINKELLKSLSNLAALSPRLRSIHCFHDGPDDTLQRMLNAIEPGSYIPPHRHLNPDKREIFLLVKGKGVVYTFDDNGNLIEYHILDAAIGNYGVEIAPGTWHTVLSLQPATVFYEFKDGPYTAFTDKDFAPWAPKEGDAEVQKYIEGLMDYIGK